jgi:hypothetical protein
MMDEMVTGGAGLGGGGDGSGSGGRGGRGGGMDGGGGRNGGGEAGGGDGTSHVLQLVPFGTRDEHANIRQQFTTVAMLVLTDSTSAATQSPSREHAVRQPSSVRLAQLSAGSTALCVA